MKPCCGYVAVAAICCLAAPACNGPIYDPASQAFPEAISPRSDWSASGDLKDPPKAIDGNINTAAVIAGGYENASLTIDLGKVCHLNMVVVEHGANEFGFCDRMAVLTSNDNKTFRQRAVVPGVRRVTTVVLVRQVLARYVRLQAVQPGSRPWSVAEVYVN